MSLVSCSLSHNVNNWLQACIFIVIQQMFEYMKTIRSMIRLDQVTQPDAHSVVMVVVVDDHKLCCVRMIEGVMDMETGSDRNVRHRADDHNVISFRFLCLSPATTTTMFMAIASVPSLVQLSAGLLYAFVLLPKSIVDDFSTKTWTPWWW